MLPTPREQLEQLPPPDPLPPGVRQGLRLLAATLAMEPTLDAAVALAERLDLRDLNEREVAWLEQVHVKTVRLWRSQGGGPDFRDAGGISYPLRWYLDWRNKGRLSRSARPRR